jgi:transposase InsO family protein
MRTKNEVLSRFQEFKSLVENQTGRKIKTLRSDDEGEYTSKGFKDFCAGAGIKRVLTVLYNPQQNEVVERKNMAIVGVAKAMLYDLDLLRFLWAEACKTTIYIQNMSPHKALGRKTTEEVFTGRRRNIRHFKIFRCLFFVMSPQRGGQSSRPLLRMGFSLVTTRIPRHTESTFLP